MKDKIESLLKKLPSLEEKLGSVEVVQDKKFFKQITQEHAYLVELRDKYEELNKLIEEQANNEELLHTETDAEFKDMLREEIEKSAKRIDYLNKDLESLLIPPDPNDSCNTIMEIRAGTGGDEAAIFVGDCFRMYRFYAEKMGWKCEVFSSAPSDMGGFKECILLFSGKNVHRFLQYEGGTHRVQRVPATESQGRVHTSAITVAVLLELPDDVEVVLNEKDLRIDTYRSSGAGGQHVNTTDSAVRITHIPSGIVCYCQEEKSQHKNKDKALRLLKAKIAEHERSKKQAAISDSRSKQVGSGDRSERIRTYNFPQNRLTDHRINLTLYSLDRIMEGDLEDVTTALVSFYHQKKLQA